MPVIRLKDGTSRFELRTGLGGLKWRVVTEGDAGSVQPNELRQVINGRISENGEIHERPGLASFTALQTDACVNSIFDYQLARPKRLWGIAVGCSALEQSGGIQVWHFDEEQSPEYQVATFSASATSIRLAWSGDTMYIAVDNALYRLQVLRAPWGTSNNAQSGTAQWSLIKTFSSFTSIKSLFWFDGQLYIALDGGAGASAIYTYDGVSLVADLTAIDAPTAFALYRVQNGGDAIVTAIGTGGNLRIRPTGSSPGSWTSVGSITATVRAMLSFKDVLFAIAADTKIYSWDGASIATARTVTGATMNGLTQGAGKLYYGYTTLTPTGIIGTYDGTTWTDAAKNLSTQVSAIVGIRQLAFYRTMLVAVAGYSSTDGVGVKLLISPVDAVTGTYIAVPPGVASPTMITNNDITQLLVA